MTAYEHELALVGGGHVSSPRSADRPHAAAGASTEPARPAPADDGPIVLGLIRRLADEFAHESVRYCHWKSNEAIAKSASGDNDLDLLIDREDATGFAAVLHRLGFRAARPPADREVPGIIDYYGRDEETGRIVHVHAHHQLVLGDDMTKNFRLPLAEAYLGSATRDGLLPLPSPEFEYTVFVLRMVVKHSPWDAQLNRKGRLTASERRELAYLQERIDHREVERLVDTHLPMLDRRLFEACARTAAESVGRATRVRTARRLLRALEPYGRRRGTADLALRMWRRQRRRIAARLPGHTGKKRITTGGALIAVIGGDGAGKSTVVERLHAMLSSDLDTRRCHMGKPPWSRLTRALKRPMRKLRTYGLFGETTVPAWADGEDTVHGPAFALWHVLTARDRYLEYRRACRAVARGTVVLCDRFPSPHLRLMDGPRAGAARGSQRNRLTAHLARLEQRYYDRMMAPDVLIVLRVSPAVAVARRQGEDDEGVRRRATEVYEADWSGTGALVVDADRSADAVFADIARAVWGVL